MIGKQPQKPGARTRHRKRILTALLFMAPALILYTGLMLYPTSQSISYSFLDWDGSRHGQRTFIGMGNFVELVQDRLVWVGLSNNLRVLAVGALFQLPLALTLAFALTRRAKLAGTYRFIYFIPGLIGSATMALLWQFMYSQDHGLINAVLQSIGLSHWIRPWMSQDGVVQWAVAIPGAYAGVGFFVIIFMAAISQIPESLYEAASIDGANAPQQLVYITLPAIWSIYLMASILIVTAALAAFVYPLIITNNGPMHRTETMASYAVWQALQNYRSGYGSAIAVFHFSVAIAATLLIRRLGRRGTDFSESSQAL